MLLNHKLIYFIPGFPLLLIIIVVVVGLSLMGQFIVRRYISHEILKLHNDVAGFMFSTLGVIYAVLLAFVVIIVWENYESTSSHVTDETNCMEILYRSSDVFPNPEKERLRSLLKSYAIVVVDKEWPAMARGESSPEIEKIEGNLWKVYLHDIKPRTELQKAFYAESVKALGEVSKMRGKRLLQAQTGIPSLLWIVLIAGGVITLAFTFFFGTENLEAQAIMTALLAAIMALMFFTILSLDFPFTGDIRISPEPFKQLLMRWAQL